MAHQPRRLSSGAPFAKYIKIGYGPHYRQSGHIHCGSIASLWRGPATSGLPPTSDMSLHRTKLRDVPNAEVVRLMQPKRSRPKAASKFNLMIVDQAKRNVGFDFLRYAMKPMPAKPRIIIAHVEGSGTPPAREPFVPSTKVCWAGSLML